MSTTRRTVMSQAATAPLVVSLLPTPVYAASAELVALGDRMASAYEAHGLSMMAVAAAEQRMRDWETANPIPQMPSDLNDEDPRWPQVLAAHQGSMRERLDRRVAAAFEFKLPKTKSAALVTEDALQETSYGVAEYDAKTMPELVYKARLAHVFDIGGAVANSIVYDLLAMRSGR